jgi:hypothetical protein
MGAHESSPEREKRRGRRRGAGGARLGEAWLGGHCRGAARGSVVGFGLCVLLAIRELLDVRKEKKRRKKERRKRKGRKRKEKKYGNFSKLENFRKIKDNL